MLKIYNLTRSQVKAWVAGALGVVATLGAVITALLPYVSESFKVKLLAAAGVVGAITLVLTTVNQSIDAGHVSLPKDVAVALTAILANFKVPVPESLYKQVDKPPGVTVVPDEDVAA